MDIPQLNEVVLLQERTWGVGSVSPIPQLIATVHNGGVVIGAFDKEKLVGFCYGFSGYVNKRNILVSHMMAIDPEYRNLGIGNQLKILQKEWAEEYGYEKIVWTFDPLESRNAYLNIHKLGAYVRKYYPSYYGEMSNDLINKGLPSDRFLVEWDITTLEDELFIKEVPATPSEAEKLVDATKVDSFDQPVRLLDSIEEPYYLVAVPANIHELKKVNMGLAQEWRYILREVFTELFSKNYALVDMVQGRETINYYVVKKLGKNMEGIK